VRINLIVSLSIRLASTAHSSIASMHGEEAMDLGANVAGGKTGAFSREKDDCAAKMHTSSISTWCEGWLRLASRLLWHRKTGRL
jgi:hypothetical protein